MVFSPENCLFEKTMRVHLSINRFLSSHSYPLYYCLVQLISLISSLNFVAFPFGSERKIIYHFHFTIFSFGLKYTKARNIVGIKKTYRRQLIRKSLLFCYGEMPFETFINEILKCFGSVNR